MKSILSVCLVGSGLGSAIAIIASVVIASSVQQHVARRARAAKLEEEVLIFRLIGLSFDIRSKIREIDDYDVPCFDDKWIALDKPIKSLKSIALTKYPFERPAFILLTWPASYRFDCQTRDSLD